MGENRNRIIAFVCIAVLALIVRIGGVIVLPLDKDPTSDSSLLIGLAESLGEGRGFQLDHGIFWTGQPTICRSPGWPIIMSVAFRFVPDNWHWRTAQAVNVLFDVVNAVLIMMLALRLGASAGTAVAAGGLYALNPILAGISVMLCRDSVGFTFLLLFLIVLSGAGGRWNTFRCIGAGLLLGCACMIRTNWLLVAFFSALGFLWLGRKTLGHTIVLLAVYTMAVLAPITPWLIRNAIVFDRFPLFGAGGGETLWGGNNDISAEMFGRYWGYVVFPDKIPGERALGKLAQEMTELEVDDYYRQKGWQWIRSNPRKLPGLVIGKLVRSYLPVPRTRGIVVIAGSVYRWLIYILSAAGCYLLWKRRVKVDPHVFSAIIMIILAQFMTVVIFCGYYRYVMPSELLLCIPAGWMLMQIWQRIYAVL